MKKILFIITVSFLGIFFSLKNIQAYDPPIGIPDPGMWGTTHPIDSVAPDTAIKCPAWPSAETMDCFYIDPDNPASTDAENTYGYPNKPRKTWAETTYNAGSYVKINSGMHNGGGQLIITFSGTAENPIWVVGGESETIMGDLIVKGSYIIFDNLNFIYPGKLSFRTHSNSTLNHAAIRNSSFVGDGLNHGSAVAVAMYGYDDTSHHDFIIYNNTISEYGDNEALVENDFHGVKPEDYSYNVWIIGNTIYNVGGDSVQVGDATYDISEKRPEYIYIGDNTFYGNHENAVDIKKADHVIVSENNMTNTNQSLVVIHNGGTNLWILNNILHDNKGGIGSTGATGVYIIGNLFYNLNYVDIFNPTDSYSFNGRAIGWYSTINIYTVDNTIYNSDIGIQVRATTGQDNIIHGNIIANRLESTGYDIYVASDAASVDMDYNRFYYISGLAEIGFGGTTKRDLTYIQSLPECTNCSEGIPGFVLPTNNFSLTEESACIDTNIKHGVYDTFYSLYNISIQKDGNNIVRPQNIAWDIGAYEYIPIQNPVESCSDNIQNQNETGIDCGGVCDACAPILTTYNLSNFISLIDNWLGIGNEISDVNSDSVVNTRDLGIIMSSWE